MSESIKLSTGEEQSMLCLVHHNTWGSAIVGFREGEGGGF